MERTGTKADLIMFLAGLEDGDQLYDLKDHREGRRLTQNNYYWQLVNKIADQLRMSKPECHNRLMREYGRPWVVANKAVFVYRPDTDETDEIMLQQEKLHFAPTSKTRTLENGDVYRRWVMLTPSHEMTVEEMSILIDGTVQEAKQLGIETMTPHELAELRAYEERRNAQKYHAGS